VIDRQYIAGLPASLKELALPTFSRLWESSCIEADDKGWGSARCLASLCDHELAERSQRRIARHLREAQLPKGKSLATFNFDLVPSVNKTYIHALASGDSWIEKGSNTLIFGPPGVGKTHLAVAIGHHLVENKYRVFFTRTTDLVQKLQAAKRDFALPALLTKLDKYDCLILDDFGYVKKNPLETSVLFELISERTERKSILLTCNQAFSEWEEIFDDKVMAVAAIDRLVFGAAIINISAESFRRNAALNKKDRAESGSKDSP
jgi:DNA replication protein DnaC